MKKRLSGLLSILILVLITFSGCGSSASKTSPEAVRDAVAPAYGESSNLKSKVSVTFNKDVATESAEFTDRGAQASNSELPKGADQNAIVATGVENNSLANAILDQRKIIRNANVSIIVDSYEKTYGKIQSLVENSGNGYIQQSNVSKQGTSGKSGMIIVRVDADKFSRILNNVKGLGEVIDANESTEDISEKFYDTESELRLLKYEQSRLEEYLKKITDPDIIFKTESRLTDIRHQIENLTGTLNKLSNLIKLSTITINITEKSVELNNKTNEKTYIEKLFKGFTDSIKGVGNFFGELILLIVSLLPVLIILTILVWIMWVFYKKYKERKR